MFFSATIAAGRMHNARVATKVLEELMVSFTDEELTYLPSQPIARFASIGGSQQPDVVPVAFEFDGAYFWVGGSGDTVLRTRKFRNIEAGYRKVALVVDDMVSFDPFIARGIRVYGNGRRSRRAPRHGGAGVLPAHHAVDLVELKHGRRAGRGGVVRVPTRDSSPALMCPSYRARICLDRSPLERGGTVVVPFGDGDEPATVRCRS